MSDSSEPQALPAGSPAPQASPTGVVEQLGKFAVPGTVLIYVFGFLIAVPHYSLSGVPVDALPVQTLAAAGVLFVVMTTASLAVGMALTLLPRSDVSWGQRGPIILAALVLPATLNHYLLGGSRGYFYVYVAGLLLLGIRFAARELADKFSQLDLRTITFNIVRGLIMILPPIGLFATTVYPTVPVRFGGGQPQFILAVPTDQSPAAVEAKDRWALVSCRAERMPPKHIHGCRSVYKVHENAAYLFVAIAEEPGGCPEKPAMWNSWPEEKPPQTICYQRIAASEIPRLEIPSIRHEHRHK